MEERTQEFVVPDGVPVAVVAQVHHALLNALRPRLVRAVLDLVSDAPWPEHVLPAVDVLARRAEERHRRALARPRPWRRRAPGEASLAVLELRPRDDEDFAFLCRLSPYSIGADAFGPGADDLAFSAHDAGTSTWVRLRDAEAEQARGRLAAAGVAADDVLVPSRPRRRAPARRGRTGPGAGDRPPLT